MKNFILFITLFVKLHESKNNKYILLNIDICKNISTDFYFKYQDNKKI